MPLTRIPRLSGQKQLLLKPEQIFREAEFGRQKGAVKIGSLLNYKEEEGVTSKASYLSYSRINLWA